MGIMQEILRLKSFVEGNLISYILYRFPQLQNGSEFHLDKRIEVNVPFGNIEIRNGRGTSIIKPEICITSQSLCLCAEVAAWDDDNLSADTKRSEAHTSVSRIGLSTESIYFAQKVMCQVFPAYLHCKTKSTNCFAFLSFTQNHEGKMLGVLTELRAKKFLQEFVRPLERDQKDLNDYYQLIYELRFHEDTDKIVNILNSH
jgi:hypothetical protein